MRWLDADPEFAARYALACEMRADALFDRIDEIANNVANDWIPDTRPGHEGEFKLNKASIMRDRLRFDALRWQVARLAPTKYADRITSELTGAGNVPLVPLLSVTFAPPDHADTNG